MQDIVNVRKKKTMIERFLDGVEKAGNKLPDPVTLFVIMAFIVLGQMKKLQLSIYSIKKV